LDLKLGILAEVLFNPPAFNSFYFNLLLTLNFLFNAILPLSNFNISPDFMQYNPQLIIKLLFFFIFTPDYNQLSPYSSASFVDWSLAVNCFNLTPN